MGGYAGKISADTQRAIDEGCHLIDESLEDEARSHHSEQSRAVGLRGADLLMCLGLGVYSVSLAACTLRHWIVDMRLSMNMALALLFSIVAAFMERMVTEEQPLTFSAGIFLYLVPVTMGLMTGVLVQYDSTGAWIVVPSDMSDREKCCERLAGSLIVLVPRVISYLIHGAVTDTNASGPVLHQMMGIILFAGVTATTLAVDTR